MPLHKTIAAGLFALSALAVAAPAQAHSTGAPQAQFSIQLGTAAPVQFRGHHSRWGHLSPRQVERELYRQGFHRVRIIGAHGPVYRAIAVDSRGGRVALTVSARSGRVLDVARIGPRHHSRGRRGYH